MYTLIDFYVLCSDWYTDLRPSVWGKIWQLIYKIYKRLQIKIASIASTVLYRSFCFLIYMWISGSVRIGSDRSIGRWQDHYLCCRAAVDAMDNTQIYIDWYMVRRCSKVLVWQLWVRALFALLGHVMLNAR